MEQYREVVTLTNGELENMRLQTKKQHGTLPLFVYRNGQRLGKN